MKNKHQIKNMEALKQKIKQLLPRIIMYYYYLYTAKKEINFDIRRRVHDKVYNDSENEKVQRDLTVAYHIVEKCLTMPEPLPGSGKKVVIGLCNKILQYEKMNLSLNGLEFKQSVSVIAEYHEFHKKIGFKLDEDVNEKVENIVNKFKFVVGVKQKYITNEEYFKDINEPFDVFCSSRHSVRNYTAEEIPLPVLYECIDMAQESPSFCNRQPTRIQIIKSTQLKTNILELQNGNRGFGHLADTLLVITSVISTTKDIHERNENHLNGGMFLMTLLYALHFKKIGTCLLNWSVSNDKDVKLRKLLNTPENEVILMIISCGYIPEKIALASSPRKSAKDITIESL